MKKRILRAIIVSILILLLTMADFIFVGYNFAIAVSENLEGQNMATNIQNVDFDVYFKQENGTTHEKQMNIDAEDTLILYISVKNKGILNNAKIQLNNSNFEIVKDKVQNSNINQINDETNEISLNSIASGNSIEIEIPIRFKKQSTFDMSYFEQENSITISGTYKDETEENVTGERKIKINWIADTDINLSQTIGKYINLGDNGILIQQDITTTVIDDKLPRERENLSINVPTIEEEKPEEIYVLLNGEKLDQSNINYDQENNLLQIQNISLITTDNQTNWGNSENNYQIIYIYPSKIGEENRTIEMNTTVNTKLFTKDEIQKQDLQNVEITKTGNIVDIQKNILKQEMYKGYLYAGTENEITFDEEDIINISNAKSSENIQIETLDNQFATEENQRGIASESVAYKGISINKQNMIDILGEAGNIVIKDENDANIAVINNNSQTDENGNINITYDTEKRNIKITTSKPILEGTLTFKHNKVLKGRNSYTKEQLKIFTKLVATSKVSTGLGEEIGEATTNLIDTKTEAKLEINNNSLSTLQTNQNVQLLITLKSDNEQYDLYRNPSIEIILPKEININVKNITQLNRQNEIQIANAGLNNNEDGTKTILIALQGEQTSFENNINEGIQISITADITIDKTVPTMSSEIIMNSTNENRSGEVFNTSIPIKISSKDGVLLINELENYNNNGDYIESLDNIEKEARLDINASSREAKGTISVINNYTTNITNFAILGTVSDITNINSINIEGRESKIYYSEDEDINTQNWQETIEDTSKIRAFKIEVAENTLNPAEVLKVSYNLQIAEKLQGNENKENQVYVRYNYLGNDLENTSKIKLTTAAQEPVNSPEDENIAVIDDVVTDMSVGLISRTGGQNLADGDTVKEGQGIKNIIRLENTGTQEITNIKISATQTNAIFYDEIVHNDGWDSTTGETDVEYITIEENEDLTEKVLTVDALEPGESITLNYQFSVKQIEEEEGETSGILKISADGIEEETLNTVTNKIEKSELKLQMRDKYPKDYTILTNRQYPFFMEATNLTNEEQKDIILTLNVPEGFSFSTDYLFEEDNYEFVSYENNVLKLRIPTIAAQEKISIRLALYIEAFDPEIRQQEISFYFTGEMQEKTYISNEMSRTFYNEVSKITAEQTGSIEADTVKDGDELTYQIRIKNEGPEDKDVTVIDYVPFAAVISDSKIEIYNPEGNLEEEQQVEIDETNNLIRQTINLKNGYEARVIINTTIDTDKAFENQITNKVEFEVFMQEITCNEVTYQVEREGGEEPEIPGVYDTYEITGIAWIDENENGYREDYEPTLSNIPVMLIDAETGEIALNQNEDECVENTDASGNYVFTKVKPGNYLVIFQYDNTQYYLTEYQKTGITTDKNSDVISKNITLQGREYVVAMTATIEVSDSNISNIDAGFIRADKFDLKLDKSVNKIIIQDSAGTTVTQFNKEKLAKVEVDAKRVNGARIIIEYQIDITNEGEVAGYVNRVTDYMPKDLTFSSEMNTNWYQTADGDLSSNALSNELINPGETKTLTLTLIKDLNSNNTGNIVNQAELTEVSNSISSNDIDSTPNNKVSEEDDMSSAEVLVSIRTGGPVVYTTLIFIITAILVSGIYLIRKKVFGEQAVDEDIIDEDELTENLLHKERR